MFLRSLIILCVTFTLPASYSAATGITGSVELDEYTFDKIVNKFGTAVVKFDVSYPYGEKHDAYLTLAKESKDVEDLLFAEVGVKDYGEKENQALATRFGAEKDDFPVVKLFKKGVNEAVTFKDDKGFTTDSLRRFIVENSDVYLSLPGCIKELDELAAKFMKHDKESRKSIITETKNVLEKIDTNNSSNGKTYLTIMEKILENGDDFTQKETARVSKLLDSKVSKEKKNALSLKLNILRSFKQSTNKKEEL